MKCRFTLICLVLLFTEGVKGQNIQIGTLCYASGFVSALFYYPATKLILVILRNTTTDLHDFRQTFQVPLEFMELVKNWKYNAINK